MNSAAWSLFNRITDWVSAQFSMFFGALFGTIRSMALAIGVAVSVGAFLFIHAFVKRFTSYDRERNFLGGIGAAQAKPYRTTTLKDLLTS